MTNQTPYPGPQVPPPYAYGQGFGQQVPVRPKPTSTTGPKVTVGIGVALLLVAVGLVVVGIVAVVRIAPTDVLRLNGSPGSGVLATVDAPGTATADLAADTDYALFLVRPDSSTATLTGAPAVTGPDGADVAVEPNSVSMNVTMGTTHAEAVASFTTSSAGGYQLEAPTTSDGVPAQLFVVRDTGISSFLGGLFGGVAGILGGVFLGLAAVTLLLIGGILWGVRRGNARRQAQGWPQGQA